MNQNRKPNPPTPDIPGRYQMHGYQALLADYCQTVDQLASLTQQFQHLQAELARLRNLLDLPARPSAARPAAPSPSAHPRPASPATIADRELAALRGCLSRIRSRVGCWLAEPNQPDTEDLIHLLDELDAFDR